MVTLLEKNPPRKKPFAMALSVAPRSALRCSPPRLSTARWTRPGLTGRAPSGWAMHGRGEGVGLMIPAHWSHPSQQANRHNAAFCKWDLTTYHHHHHHHHHHHILIMIILYCHHQQMITTSNHQPPSTVKFDFIRFGTGSCRGNHSCHWAFASSINFIAVFYYLPKVCHLLLRKGVQNIHIDI